jgi:hypothetical protein
MAHFARLDQNNVIQEIIVVNNDVVNNLSFPESEPIGVKFCQELFGSDTNWKQTSYSGDFRKNYAAIGSVYDSATDIFINPQPYHSWTLNKFTMQWEPPIPYPSEGGPYVWNENEKNWFLIGG